MAIDYEVSYYGKVISSVSEGQIVAALEAAGVCLTGNSVTRDSVMRDFIMRDFVTSDPVSRATHSSCIALLHNL